MPLLRIADDGVCLPFSVGPSLLDLLAQAGRMPASPCGGTGICGKCAVTITENLPPPTTQEMALFSAQELASGLRLSCSLHPATDISISLKSEGKDSTILSEGYLPDFVPCQPFFKKAVSLAALSAPQSGLALEAVLCRALGVTHIPAPMLQGSATEDGMLTAVYMGNSLLALEAGDTTQSLYGLAVDIGTTTVVVSLVDLHEHRELATQSAINPQKNHGFDVLSRLSFCMEHHDGVRQLQSSITQCLNGLIIDLCKDTGVCSKDIWSICIAANTSMLHLLLGIDPSSLGRAPFAPVFISAQRLHAADIGLHAAKSAQLYCLPSVSAFIGADIVAGILVSELHKATETVLFIDIGTNGEMILSHKGRLFGCSCAAGPALEGMNISCGMRAAEGAVEKVEIHGSEVRLHTIGNAPPVGICGSGVLSAISTFLRKGLIQPRGNLLKETALPEGDPCRALLCRQDGKAALRLAPGASEILLSQKDIRQVQLAKGAIMSGVHSLLRQTGLEPDDIDRVLIAGQFGAHLPASSLTGCGILPAALENKVSYMGNTSKSGAFMALLSVEARREMEHLAETVQYVELSMLEGFDRLFVSCLDFPESNVD